MVRRGMKDQGGEGPSPFVYVWSYEVTPDNRDAFFDLYGPEGSWVALFRQASGYLDTQLLADLNQVGRFVTIDRWASKEDFDRFRTDHTQEFDRLDTLGEEITSTEMLLGEFGAA